MKKLLLLFSVFGFTALTAQSPLDYAVEKSIEKKIQNKNFATGFEEIKGNVLPNNKSQVAIGETTYDLQTNASTNKSLLVGADGTLHATWIRSTTFDIGASDRGTGYNSYDGFWGPAPTARIDAERTGWPNLFELSDGTIGVVAHTGGSGTMVTTKAPGSSEWTSTIIPGDTDAVWNRVAATGNTIHVIVARQAAFDGISSGLVYRRSDDGGSTWTDPILLPGFTDHYVEGSADSYAIAADGDNVAVVYGLYARRTVLFKSTDGGVNWNSTVIADVVDALNPDDTQRTSFLPAFCPEGVTVTLDSNGTAHVAYNTRLNFFDDDPTNGPNIYYQPVFSQNLMYWNEGMEAPMHVGAAFRLDDDGDGDNFGGSADGNGYGGGLLTHPTIGRDADNNVYIAYDAALTNAVDAAGNLLRDAYLVKSTDAGATWEGPYNVSNDATTEASFPVIPQVFDGDVPVLYQKDVLAGVAVQDYQTEYVENSIEVEFINPDDINGDNVDLALNPPVVYTRWAGLGLDQGCDFDFEFWGIYAFDYPDGQVEVNLVPLDGSTFDSNTLGETEVFLSATDSDGNTTAVDTLLITVFEDVDAPVWTYDGQTTFQVELDSEITIPEVGFVDNSLCGANAEISSEGSVDTSTPGTYTITYNVSDFAGNAADPLVFTYVVLGAEGDTTPPELNVGESTNVSIDADANFDFVCPSYTALDLVDGDLTDSVIVTGCDEVNAAVPGVYVVTFEVTDAAGNSSSYTITYTVEDTSAPILGIITGQNQQDVDCNGTLPDVTTFFGVIDNGSPSVIGNFTINTISGDVDVTTNGDYQVVYSVTDAAGNESNPATITYTVSGCTGTDVQTVFGGVISVLPNPTNGELFVDLSETEVREAVISVFDIQGRLLQEVQADNTASAIRLDLTNLTDGVYMLQINAGEFGIAVDRIILTK